MLKRYYERLQQLYCDQGRCKDTNAEIEELPTEDTTGNTIPDLLIDENIILDIEENIVSNDNCQQLRHSNRRRTQPIWRTEYDVRDGQV